MVVKESVSSSVEIENRERLIKALSSILKELEVPGILSGVLNSFLEKDMDFNQLVNALETFASEKSKFKNLIPVFNENLEVDNAVDKEYGMLANYKPLFDEFQNLIGFVPHWVYMK